MSERPFTLVFAKYASPQCSSHSILLSYKSPYTVLRSRRQRYARCALSGTVARLPTLACFPGERCKVAGPAENRPGERPQKSLTTAPPARFTL